MPRNAAPLSTLVVIALLLAVAAPLQAAPPPLSDIGESMLLAQKEPIPHYFRDAPRSGPNVWLDPIGTRAGRFLRLFTDDGDGGVVEFGHYAQLATLGFDWADDMFALTVTNAIVDAGRFSTPGKARVVESASFFTSPAVLFSIRPVSMLRLDVDASYSYAWAVGDADTSHQLAFGGVHVVVESPSNFFGICPQFELAVGARGAWAQTSGDGIDITATAVLVGGRVAAVIDLGDDLALFTGVGAYYGIDLGDAGLDADDDAHLNIEWTAGLRWYPLGS